jgi:hypothetical protein
LGDKLSVLSFDFTVSRHEIHHSLLDIATKPVCNSFAKPVVYEHINTRLLQDFTGGGLFFRFVILNVSFRE